MNHIEEKPKSRKFFQKYERRLSFAAFVAGFIWDWVTLKFVSLEEAGLILGAYLFVIAFSIVIFNNIYSRQNPSQFSRRVAGVIPYVIQFMFGTLFNAAFIFYTQSAELYSSWPFVLFLVAAVLGNEVFHHRHTRLSFQLTMFFIAAYLYFVFTLPILFAKISDGIFIFSGAVSLIILFIVMYFLSRFARQRFLEKHKTFVTILILLFTAFNILYFVNIIPPIPLALKSAAVYHNIYKSGDKYYALYEPAEYALWSKENRVYHAAAGESAYLFTAIFAPANITAPVYHEWWHFDEKTDKWVMVGKTLFNITGGRDGGYRGYSVKRNIDEGKWRVYVTTERGARLGRISFRVERVSKEPKLESDVR